MDWASVVLVGLGAGAVLSGLAIGTWLRAATADQAELRHRAERDVDALTVAALESQLAAARRGNDELRAELEAGPAEWRELAARWAARRDLVAAPPGGSALDRVLRARDPRGPAAAAGGAPAGAGPPAEAA